MNQHSEQASFHLVNYFVASALQTELDNLNLRVFYLLNSQEDVQSDVKVMKRAALKTRQDLTTQELEKQRQVWDVK